MPQILTVYGLKVNVPSRLMFGGLGAFRGQGLTARRQVARGGLGSTSPPHLLHTPDILLLQDSHS